MKINSEKLIVIVLIVFGGIILIFTGYLLGSGFSKNKQKNFLNPENYQKPVDIINSKIVKSFVVFGKVSSIDEVNRIITITEGKENMNIYVKEDAQISSTVSTVSTAPIIPDKSGSSSKSLKQTKFSFADIKIGNQVSAVIKIFSDNKLEAVSLVIVSAQ